MGFFPESVPDEDFLLYLANKILRRGNLCTITITHNGMWWHMYYFVQELQLLQFGYCTLPYSDFHILIFLIAKPYFMEMCFDFHEETHHQEYLSVYKLFSISILCV